MRPILLSTHSHTLSGRDGSYIVRRRHTRTKALHLHATVTVSIYRGPFYACSQVVVYSFELNNAVATWSKLEPR